MDRGRELALLPLDDEGAAALLASIPAEQRTECWWLILPDGRPVRGDHGGGVLLLTALGITRPLGRLLDTLGLSAAVDAADKLLARYRSKLSPFVPDGPAPLRFP